MSSPDPRFLDDLRQRGLVHQMTSPALETILQGGRVTAYIGFDPTAASLHIGSLLPVTMLMRLQRAGHRPIAVVGGGTGLIGDPSGKAAERALLTPELLAVNLAGMRGQLERFLDFSGEHAAVLVDNSEWLGPMRVMDFLRDIGKHFSINAMVARDSVRDRLENREQGISYTEFSYMLLQAYDFLALHDRFGCTLQLGGSDQWGNIVSGTDLIRRVRGAESYGLTQPLVLKSDGTKFGKSEQGNVWLDPGMTGPYSMYQFLLNTDDGDVVRYLKYFTFLAFSEIDALEAEVRTAPIGATPRRPWPRRSCAWSTGPRRWPGPSRRRRRSSAGATSGPCRWRICRTPSRPRRARRWRGRSWAPRTRPSWRCWRTRAWSRRAGRGVRPSPRAGSR